MTPLSRFAVAAATTVVVSWCTPCVAADAQVARGKYIVQSIAMCGTCHSPRSSDSETARPLSGGPVPYLPVRPVENWAEAAPRIAGSPPGTDEQIVRLLMTGISRTGQRPRPPMPQFRMTRQDAESVVAYLRSLSSAP